VEEKMKPPLVTITRSAWRDLVAQATGHIREGGGLLVGSKTRYGNFCVEHVPGMTHEAADEGHIKYRLEEISNARFAAHEAYQPLTVIGMWHTHPWPICGADALSPQISDDWNAPISDVSEMIDGEIEIIAVTFPWPGFWLPHKDYIISTRSAEMMCRAEPWLRVKRGKVIPCRIQVR